MRKKQAKSAAGGDSKSAAPLRFNAILHRPKKALNGKANPRKAKARGAGVSASERASEDWTFLTLPKHASAKLPSRSQVSIEGTMNGTAFQATLQPDGQGGHWLKVDKKLRDALKRAGTELPEAGDSVNLVIRPVAAGNEPEPEVPADVRKALAAASSKAKEVWSDITPIARRDWVQWITSGKLAETRTKRITTACDMLAKGKRRPCCFDRSGMYGKSMSCPIADD